MKKLLFLFALLCMGVMTVFAQVPVNEQLTYQTVVRNAQNKLVFSQDNVSVTVEVCKLDGSVVWYSENHTGLSTNANGLLTLMVGGGTLVSGAWADIDWSDAAIRTTVSYDPGSGTVSIPSGLAPVSAVPYALQAGNASNITNLIGDAIHDSIVNNISEQIHDSIVGLGDDLTDLENRVNIFNTHVCDSVKDCVTGWIHDSIANNISDNISSQIHDSLVYNINNNISEQIHDTVTNYLTNNHYVTETNLCTTIEAHCTNVALRNGNTFTGEHHFTGADSVTVPNAITPDLATALASTCNQEAVNLCDLLAVFDSLNRRLNELQDTIQHLRGIMVTQTGGGTVGLCDGGPVSVTYTAVPHIAGSYNYAWSVEPAAVLVSQNGNTATYTYTTAGTYNVTVTATSGGRIANGGTFTTVLSSGGTPVSVGLCESDGVVSVMSVSGSPNYINWGDGQTGNSVSTSTEHDYVALGNGSHSVTITASNADGCTFSRTMTVNVLGSGSTVADRTVKPCAVGIHPAQTGSTYTGNGYSGANHGLETVNGSGQITSVTDYDGNEYPVVQIGSQCWMAENLRCSHSPKTGSNIVVTAVQNYGSKMAAWRKNDESTYKAKRYGLLYNWCAAMDTANPSGYVEVATAENTSNYFSFTPSSNHQGVCPKGWHVPTDAEWNKMEKAVCGSDWQASYETASPSARGTHGNKLSTGCDWQIATGNAVGNYTNAERNESGFSALPAGNFNHGNFNSDGACANLWTSSQSGIGDSAWYRFWDFYAGGVGRFTPSKDFGLSVRCVRD